MEKNYLDNDAYGKADSEYTDSKAKKVCIASLVLRYAVPSILIFVSYILSWVFMIKVRLRRREYKFGKVLMWLYIAETLLVIFVMTLQLILCFYKAGIH